MDEMQPEKHRSGKKGEGRGGGVNQTLPFHMVLQIIVGFSSFQVSQSLEISKYVLIQHMYPSTNNGQENTLYEQNSLHENYQNQNSLKTRTRFICEFPPS